jgi:Lrp/AsnC family transcriptional regulator, leucine-responsive regulatory protein
MGQLEKTMLDGFDRKILALIQKDCNMAQRDISEAVNLSAAKVGRPITIIVEVSVESEKLVELDRVRKRFTSCPAVNQVYYVTGEVDFVLILNVGDMSEFEALTRELFFAEGNVKRFRTLVVMDRAKMTLEVPTVD